MLEGLRLALWRLGLYPDRCPYCGKDLVKIGHIKEFYQRYRCPSNACQFNNY